MSNEKDSVRLHTMAFEVCHGVDDWEKQTPSRFEIDIEMQADLSTAGMSDNLADTINYSETYSQVAEIMHGPSCNLIERLAEQIADRILSCCPCEVVCVRIRKANPPVGGPCVAAEIEIWRSRK